MKLAVFDFDSTLMDGETIDFYAKELGLVEKVSAITDEAMQGNIDFFESLRDRVKLLKGLEYSKIERISKQLPYMPGAREIVPYLQSKGVRVICFSGGFRVATSYAKEQLGLDAEFSNTLHQKDGCLTGEVGGEMMFGHSKGDMLQRLQSLLGIDAEQTMVVGDGANDLSMFAHAHTKIAFCAKPILQEAATHCIATKDLMQIPELVAL